MSLGAAALRAGDLAEAEAVYTATFRLADEVGNESYAIFAADYAADAALAQHAPERALALYERIASRYPAAIRFNIGRFRIPNNLAVLRARSGRIDDGIVALEGALDEFAGRGISPAFPFAPHAVLTRNLVRMHGRRTWDARSEAVLSATLAWVEPQVDRDHNSAFTRGAHRLLKDLGDFASAGSQRELAKRLYARADEVAARELANPASRGLDRPLCEPRVIEGVNSESCYEIFE